MPPSAAVRAPHVRPPGSGGCLPEATIVRNSRPTPPGSRWAARLQALPRGERGRARPSTERAAERARLRVAGQERDLGDGGLAVGEVAQGDVPAHALDQGREDRVVCGEAALERPYARAEPL